MENEDKYLDTINDLLFFADINLKVKDINSIKVLEDNSKVKDKIESVRIIILTEDVNLNIYMLFSGPPRDCCENVMVTIYSNKGDEYYINSFEQNNITELFRYLIRSKYKI